MLVCRSLKSAERAYGETSPPQASRASRGDLHPLCPRSGSRHLGRTSSQRCGRGVDERSAGRVAHHEAPGDAPRGSGVRRRRAHRGADGRGRDHRRRHAFHHGRRHLRAAERVRGGAGAAAHERRRADLEPLVLGRAGTRRRRGRGGEGLHRARLDRCGPLPAGRREAGGGTRDGSRAPARRERGGDQQHRGRRPRIRGRRRPPPGRSHDRRLPPDPGGGGHDDQAADRHPVGVGRQRILAVRVAGLRARQDGVRTPHRRRQRLLPRGGSRGGPRRLRLPHQVAALERRRLQLPDRSLRHHLRRPLWRRRARRHRRPGARLQHREHGHLRHGDVHQRHAAVRGRHVPGAAAGVEAGRTPRRPPGHGHARLRLRAEVRHRAACHVPGHRRAPRRQLHRLPGRATVLAAAQRAQGRRAYGPAEDLRLHRGDPGHQPERRRRTRSGHHRLHHLADGHLASRDPRRRRHAGAAPDRRRRRRGDDVGGSRRRRQAAAGRRLYGAGRRHERRRGRALRHGHRAAGHGRAGHRERDRRAGSVQSERRRPGRRERAGLPAGRGRDGTRVRRRRRRYGAAPGHGLEGHDQGRPEGRLGRPHLLHFRSAGCSRG